MHDVKKRINTAWNQFLRDPDADIAEIRPVILESWRRSRDMGVNSYTTRKTVLAPEELQRKIQQNRQLYDTAVPIMENLYEFVKGTGFIAILSDRNGLILKVFGDDNSMDAAESNLLIEGADRSEASLGTNGIGTTLFVRKPLQVWADEHYFKPHCLWSCAGAPILDSKGELLGALCLSGSWEAVHFHTLGMVVMATQAITKQLELQKLLARTNNTRRKLDKVIELLNYGLLFTDTVGRITQINQLAALLLNIKDRPKQDILATNINDYLPKSEFNLDSLLKTAMEEREFDVDTFLGTLHCSVAVIPAAEDGEGEEVAITLRKAEHIHRMINRIVGSSARFTWDDIVGQSPSIREIKRLARVAAPYPSNVLLTGESGTGKELFAQSIHNGSKNSDGPFVAVNCGAIPKSLIESELFGYEAGAFSGAKRDGSAGKFELANHGTIFLDEIGDTPFEIQIHLLRILQMREVTRIGGHKPIPLDIRVIAATNVDLEKAVHERTFRSDLYYRLKVMSINIPPLRERDGDVLLLAGHFVEKNRKANDTSARGFRADAATLLRRYSWPGNIRELENAVERACLLCREEYITPEFLPESIRGGADANADSRDGDLAPIAAPFQQIEATTIDEAEKVDMNRRTLYRKLEKHRIVVERHRRP